jgi:hypothetical protein
MSITTYNQVLTMARQLDLTDQLRLLQVLLSTIRSDITGTPQHSILELKGLGHEVWQDMDVATYLHEERGAWNG